MIMATISENLQTIADSTAAIKQAIIDKGGTIEGDITTWASAISGIESGGELDLITFYLGSNYVSRICPNGMTWAEYIGSVFNIKDAYYGSIYTAQDDTVLCSYGYIVNPDTGGYLYSPETIYPQTYSISHGSGGAN